MWFGGVWLVLGIAAFLCGANMGAMRSAASEWRWFVGLACRALVALLACVASMVVHAQASGVAANVVLCGPEGASGVTYVSAGGHRVVCGTDANGNPLELQVSTQFVAMNVDDTTDDGGSQVGAAIGGAVLGVMAIAFGFRSIRNFINSSSEG